MTTSVETNHAGVVVEGSAAAKYLFWKVHTRQYAIPLAQVREILALPMMTDLPVFHSTLKGVFNLRGKIISVADVRHKLVQNVGYTPPQRPYVIALDIGELEVGLVVDDIVEVAQVRHENLFFDLDLKTANSVDKQYILGAIEREGNNMALLLNVEKLVGVVAKHPSKLGEKH
jgi:purine-binding chemotaxis protein CheW